MRTTRLLQTFLASLTASAIARAELQSPFDLAARLEQSLARFDGTWMPDTNMVYAIWCGVLPLPETVPTDGTGFPQAFIDGLVSFEEYGVTTYPVSARVNDDTGTTAFRNADQTIFWETPPTGTYQSDWLVQLFGKTPSPLMAELLRPSHIEIRAVFVPEQDVQTYNDARFAALNPPSQTVQSWPVNHPAINVTMFTPSADTLYFASEWNSVAYFPTKKMNVLFKPDLDAPAWSAIHTVPVSTSLRRAVFEVPWAMVPPPPAAHDPSCSPTEIVVASPLDPAASYTNTVCECALPMRESPRGFFKMGIQEPGSGQPPAWWRVLHGLAPWDSWEDDADFNGDGHTNRDKYGLGVNPAAPPDPNGVSAASIQYAYDGDDRLTGGFIGAGKDAAVRSLSPAGNPNVQQERTAQ